MKTTIEVDDVLWGATRMLAITQGRPTGRVLEDALRLYLSGRENPLKDWVAIGKMRSGTTSVARIVTRSSTRNRKAGK